MSIHRSYKMKSLFESDAAGGGSRASAQYIPCLNVLMPPDASLRIQ
jgi:hypothetical protein